MKKLIIAVLFLTLSAPAWAADTDPLTYEQQYAFLANKFYHSASAMNGLANMSINLYFLSNDKTFLQDGLDYLKSATAYASAASYYDSLIVYVVAGENRVRDKDRGSVLMNAINHMIERVEAIK